MMCSRLSTCLGILLRSTTTIFHLDLKLQQRVQDPVYVGLSTIDQPLSHATESKQAEKGDGSWSDTPAS